MKAEAQRLIEMVERGIQEEEIMKELGIQSRASLRRIYCDALVEAGKIRGILTDREVKKKRREKELTIGKRGTLLLSRKLLVDEFGFKVGDKFSTAKRRDSIILRKTE